MNGVENDGEIFFILSRERKVEWLKYGDWDEKSFGVPAAELLEIAEWGIGWG